MTALAFIIAIKSPAVATSWPDLTLYAQRTLRSVCRQTSGDFRVVVVCNRMPEVRLDTDRLTVIEADFPNPGQNYGAKGEDKKRKLVTALIALRDQPPDYVMVVDADDCVSRDVVRHVAEGPRTSPGWYFESGFEYFEDSRFIRKRQSRFDQLCGTSVIVRYDLLRFQDELAPDGPLGENDRFLVGHPFAQADLAARGAPIEPLPFPGAVYIRDRIGESMTMQEPLMDKLKRNPREVLRVLKLNTVGLLDLQRLSDDLRDEFGLTPLRSGGAEGA